MLACESAGTLRPARAPHGLSAENAMILRQFRFQKAVR
jgi:hypothetical protein